MFLFSVVYHFLARNPYHSSYDLSKLLKSSPLVLLILWKCQEQQGFVQGPCNNVFKGQFYLRSIHPWILAIKWILQMRHWFNGDQKILWYFDNICLTSNSHTQSTKRCFHFRGESIVLEMMLLSVLNCEITNSRIMKSSLLATLLQCQC